MLYLELLEIIAQFVYFEKCNIFFLNLLQSDLWQSF